MDDTITVAVKICEMCGGYGYGLGHNHYTGKPAKFVCPVCHGTGCANDPLVQAVLERQDAAGEVEQAR